MRTFLHNVKDGEQIIITLEEMGHPQLSTPMQMNNPTMENIANKKTQQKRTKDMDIHFYWVHDIIHKGYYNIFLIPGKTN